MREIWIRTAEVAPGMWSTERQVWITDLGGKRRSWIVDAAQVGPGLVRGCLIPEAETWNSHLVQPAGCPIGMSRIRVPRCTVVDLAPAGGAP